MIARSSQVHLCGAAFASLWLWAFVAAPAHAQAPGGIYTCVDANGRKLTSDRPIPACIDREQKILNPSGTVRGNMAPALTPQEIAAQEQKEKLLAQERNRKDEEKRRDRALLVRYPNRTAHDEERAEALKQIEVVKAAASNRVIELKRQRSLLDEEMEFYKKDPTKAPARLRRQVDELAESLVVQTRFITDQDGEIKRVSARFDEELVRLKLLWPLRSATASAPVTPATSGAKTTKSP
jgi:Domain of unknown function (DUF4124)